MKDSHIYWAINNFSFCRFQGRCLIFLGGGVVLGRLSLSQLSALSLIYFISGQ